MPSSEPTASPQRGLVLLGCLLLALVVYVPTAVRAGFLNFDDNLFFGPDNPLFAQAADAARRDGLFAGLAIVLDPRHVVADVYLPVAHGSLWLDYHVFDGAPFGPHLVSALLHAFAGYLLARLWLALGLPPLLALGGSALFLLHPALCESVAWVSGRKDVLAGLFGFAALLQTARFAARSSWLRLCGIGALGVLAMYSKATAVVLPLLALLVVVHLGGDRRRFWAPFALLLVTVPIAWHHQLLAATAGTMVGGSALARLPQAPGAFAHYLQTALWPAACNVLYPEVATLERFRACLWPALGLLAALLLAGGLAWRRPAGRPLALGLLGFLLALLPFNTAWPASVIAAADRYLYLALPFLAVAVLAAATALCRRPLLAATVLAVPLLISGLQRAPAFASSTALWNASLATDPDNAVAWLNLLQAESSDLGFDLGRARTNADRAAAAARYPEHQLRAHALRAQLALAAGEPAAAADAALQAVAAADRLAAGDRVAAAVARDALVQALLLAITPLRHGGRIADARGLLQRAEGVAADDPRVVAAGVVLAVDELAAELRARGESALAEADPRAAALRRRLDAALATAPRDGQLLLAEGTLERLHGRRMPALRSFRRAADAQPLLVDAWLGAAEVCLQAGLYADGESYARAGIVALTQRGRAVDPRLRHALARALAGQNRLDEAILHLEPYVQMRPGDRDVARLLSSLLMGKAVQRLTDPRATHAELQQLIDRALAVNPEEPRVDLVRAKLLRDQRKFADAVAALDRARAALPEHADAVTQLAENLRDLGYQCWREGDDDGAVTAWQRFLAVAPPELATDAVRMQLQGLWRRAEDAGIAARKAGDRAAAAAAFGRCLRIDPDQHWACYLLASVLIDDPAADLVELDRLSARALAWQQRHRLDRSRQVVLRALVLRKRSRDDEARTLLREYLAAPDADADTAVLAAMRSLARELGG